MGPRLSVPPRQVRRWQPPAPPRRPARRVVRWWQRPFVLWRRHPWIPVWLAVVLTPLALLGLRLIDDTAAGVVVHAILGLLIVAFVGIVVFAVRRSLGRSQVRALSGGGGALVVAALLVLPMLHVIGQRPCPEHMGVDRGVQISSQLFDTWRKGGSPPGDVWTNDDVGSAWKARVDKLALLDYRLTDSGCWERLAPVSTSDTWHEYRVTVQRGAERFSKVVTVHTRAARSGWAVAEVDGPEP